MDTQTNLAKHAIDFLLAANVFGGPVLEVRDDRKDYGEERWIAVGRADGQCLVIVYTWRATDRHLISVWPAKRHIRARYTARFLETG